MIKRILAIDIGNTAVKIGFYEAGRISRFGTMNFRAIPIYARKLARSGDYCHLDVVICSTIPKRTLFLKSHLRGIKGLRLWDIGHDFYVNIRLKHRSYNTLGMDRRVAAYGAIRMYRLPMLLITYGTAATYDYIDSKGLFVGGMIIPGPETAFNALGQRAALLPKNLPMPKKTKRFFGRNTRECMETGILEGYGAMTEELIRRFKARCGSKLRVLATGGLAKVIAPYAKGIDIIDPMHTIKSMIALWREHQKIG